MLKLMLIGYCRKGISLLPPGTSSAATERAISVFHYVLKKTLSKRPSNGQNLFLSITHRGTKLTYHEKNTYHRSLSFRRIFCLGLKKRKTRNSVYSYRQQSTKSGRSSRAGYNR